MKTFRLAVTLLSLSSAPLCLNAQTYTGRIGAGGSSPEMKTGGTVVVAVALSDGLVLAADSRLILEFQAAQEGQATPPYKIVSDSARKLFDVGEIGIATYGKGFILGRTINSFVSEFTQTGDVLEIAKKFGTFFAKYYDDDVESQKSNAPPILGFLIAGYDKTGIGRVLEVEFPGKREPVELHNTRDTQGADWCGQTDVIGRLIKGVDPTIYALPIIRAIPEDSRGKLIEQMHGLEYYLNYARGEGLEGALT